jgi:ubiquinone/menaquinone biosynthesis C-methylase UbiE
MHSQINFGYPWWLDYGHLTLAVLFLALFALGWVRRWNRVAMVLIALATVWALTAFAMLRFGFDVNGRATLPTQAFLRSGTGKVLDMGAGTGRSTLMVLEARPHSTVVALDSFSDSYVQHFGGKKSDAIEKGTAKLMANLRAAGVDSRCTVQPGDMRQMPFEPATFDAVVSAYAIDHLNRQGIGQALGEANRVLKPGGEFLLIVIARDVYLKFAFGPLMAHSGMVLSDFWERNLRDAGFEILEQGNPPATKFVLARKP